MLVTKLAFTKVATHNVNKNFSTKTIKNEEVTSNIVFVRPCSIAFKTNNSLVTSCRDVCYKRVSTKKKLVDFFTFVYKKGIYIF